MWNCWVPRTSLSTTQRMAAECFWGNKGVLTVLMFKCVGFCSCKRIWPHQNSLLVGLKVEAFIMSFKLHAKYSRYLVLSLRMHEWRFWTFLFFFSTNPQWFQKYTLKNVQLVTKTRSYHLLFLTLPRTFLHLLNTEHFFSRSSKLYSVFHQLF